jgi:hypothetical protein
MGIFVATSVAFYLVFGIFITAVVFLAVWVAVWAVRRDLAGRKRWIQEHESPGAASGDQSKESSA